jgi:hypothetical protein
VSLGKALRKSSLLSSSVRKGKQALRKSDRERIVEEGSARVLDSLDLDAATRVLLPAEARWDYLLGTSISEAAIVAAEVHPANTGEARLIVAKKRAAAQLLKAHLDPNARVRRWYWISSGSTKITRGTPEARLLDKEGIRLVGRLLKLPNDT